MIDAKGLLTRAQMAAIVSRSFGCGIRRRLWTTTETYCRAHGITAIWARQSRWGAFQGANGLLNPDAPITREEAFTVLARAFALEGGRQRHAEGLC